MTRYHAICIGVLTTVLGLVLPWWPLSMGGVLLLSVGGPWPVAILAALLLDFLWQSSVYGYAVPVCSLVVLIMLLIRHHVTHRMLSRMPDRL